MGLDLQLTAIPNKANFIIGKARENNYYATDIDKVHHTHELKQQLKMVQANPAEKHFESSLAELIKDSEFLTSLYPGRKVENYVFRSGTRGYETINYLILQYLQHNHRQESFNYHVFYGGTDIDFAKQHTRLEYIDNIKIAQLSDLLNSIEFDRLLYYYDYDKMQNVVYKLTTPEHLHELKKEFKELQKFYLSAKNLDAFIIVKVS
jgi:hypothetical protein